MTMMERRRALMMSSGGLIPENAWQIVSQAGSDANSISFSISADLSKSCVWFFESTATSDHDPICMQTGTGLFNRYVNASDVIRYIRAADDSGGTVRTPTITVTASEISITSTKPFSSDVTYTLYYAEFDDPT